MLNRAEEREKELLKRLGPDALELVAAHFRVLAEPLRLRLLREIAVREQTVTQLSEILESTQPNVSKHLKLLQEAGFVQRRQEKNSAFFSLVDPSLFGLIELSFERIQSRLLAQTVAMRSELGPESPRF